MKIAYACDDAYIEQTGISLISVFENNKGEDIIIYLISKGISKENIKILDEICLSYNSELRVVEFENIAWDLPKGCCG